MTILVTGGAGFIGSNFLHYLSNQTDEEIICIDKFTYASSFDNVLPKIPFYISDITSKECCESIFSTNKIRTVFHLAAESHVDNSIKDCSKFIHTNILGTVNLLNYSLKYEVDKFIHISTDEVYGSIENGSFVEDTNYHPRNPYSASKASSDHFVMAYYHTYGLPVNITNCSNNYGPRQHGEKFIPKVIKNILNDKKIPVYGDGNQIRDWLYVLDHCSALVNVWRNGRVGEKYNIGSGCEISNIDLVRKILEYFKKDDSMIEFVPDRLGHDRRYSTDFTKINQELGWSPTHNLDIGLQKTISWYENRKNKI